MAFRLHPDESVKHGLRRLARQELSKTRAELRSARPPRGEVIHEARRSLKKARAILQLVDDDGGSAINRSKRQLRSVNRALSRLRDADVMLDTLGRFRTKRPQRITEQSFARLRGVLAERKRAATKSAGRRRAWKAVKRSLRAARRHTGAWKPAHHSRGTLTHSIRAVHRRGRKAMTRARQRRRASDFHAWRKEIKSLWYALRLVEQSDADVRRDVRALHEAETLLGNDHNLVVLCEALSKPLPACRGIEDLDRLRLIVDREQCRLREKAFARVKSIYGRRSGAYARAIAEAWKIWRHDTTRRQDRGGRRRAA